MSPAFATQAKLHGDAALIAHQRMNGIQNRLLWATIDIDRSELNYPKLNWPQVSPSSKRREHSPVHSPATVPVLCGLDLWTPGEGPCIRGAGVYKGHSCEGVGWRACACRFGGRAVRKYPPFFL